MEVRRASASEQSRRLPPPEAWKQPDRWMDLSTGLVKPNVPKLVLPTDDRGLLKPDSIVETVNERFFWSDYDWPYDPFDTETAPDDHHFYFTARSYHPSENNGSDIPRRFRELPTHIGWMPRQFHNTIHDLTATPEVPSMEVMQDYYSSYQLAYQAFRRLIEAARKTTKVSLEIGQRRRSVEMGLITPSSLRDEVAQEFFHTFFAKHFQAYSNSVDIWQMLTPADRALLELPKVPKYKPHEVVRRLGGVAGRQHINFVPVLRTA